MNCPLDRMSLATIAFFAILLATCALIEQWADGATPGTQSTKGLSQ